MRLGALVLGLGLGLGLGCARPIETSAGASGAGRGAVEAASAAVTAAPAPDPIAPLHAFEEARRASADFATLPPSDRAFGPDPIAVRALPGSPARFVGLLRGRDAVVLLDASLRELARAPAPALPTGLAIADGGEIFVSGEQSPRIARLRARGDALRAEGSIDLTGDVHGLRDVAAGREGVIYAVDEREGRLFAIPPGHGKRAVFPAGAGAFRVAAAGDRLVVDCLLDHELAVFALDARGMPSPAPPARIHHDGPIWAFDAVSTREGLLIAAGGVEDHPLDRTGGSFGYIDSFVFLYRLAPGAAAPERLAALNVSAHGVITPKALLLRAGAAGGATVTVAGYGSDRLAEIAWPHDFTAEPSVTTRAILPGAASMAISNGAIVFADPLLDAWFQTQSPEVEQEGGKDGKNPGISPSFPPSCSNPSCLPAPAPVPDSAPPRTAASHVGEALFFTNLMAPWNSSEGPKSRFTCETCHFEGYVDGRTHHTGRGEIRATTKPLLGLFNNRPHFSRALDPDMATMVDNEFRVAGALSGHAPRFSADEAELSWTPLLGADAGDLDAVGLRRALMTFLMEFTHRPNPAALGRARFGDRERSGAEIFARRCEGCHEARLASDLPASRVPAARWEALVLGREGPILWGKSAYEKTGVEPYVHDRGARVPSLRRLYKKRPYFTNGKARSLREVLDRVRAGGEAFAHDGAGADLAALDEGEKEALLAFLDLL